jgi:ferrous iron transporter FeoB
MRMARSHGLISILTNFDRKKATKNGVTRFILAGNPNTGKTTLFNSLTRSNEHVGNWHGVTVSEKEKYFLVEGKQAILVDLPGLYSLTPLSYEEEVASDYILKNDHCPIINICDINNLRRNLFLTLQLHEVGVDFVLFINTFKKKNKMTEKIKNTEKILNKMGIKYYIGDASNKNDIKSFKKILKNHFLNENDENKKNNNLKIGFKNINNSENNKLIIKNQFSDKLTNYKIIDEDKLKVITSIINEECAIEGYDINSVAIRIFENDEKIKDKLKLNNQKKEIINNLIPKNNFLILNEKRFNLINELIGENYCNFNQEKKYKNPKNKINLFNKFKEKINKKRKLKNKDLENKDQESKKNKSEEKESKKQESKEKGKKEKELEGRLPNEKQQRAYGSSVLDKIFLNKYLALPIFFGVLLLVFYLTFFSLGASLSSLLREFIQNVIGGNIVSWLRGVCDVAWVVDLVETGIFGGVGMLLAFLPQVILLFFFLSLIEDSGYLARVAFLFEDVFAKVGLSGKSVYSLLMGFGCSTTAALTARNMEDKNAKIKTALLTPYMSCSAKIPIYAVIGGAFFGATNVFIIFGLYMLGVIVALLLSLILEQKTLKSKEQSFILEFPAYRIPSFIRVVKILWENLKLFMIRIGTVILSLNIIIWILQSFSFSFRFVPTSSGQVSMLQVIGTLISPIFAPLGFGNWGAASALIAGLTAKEIIVSSIAMFNGVNVLGDNMKNQTMRSILDPASVVFFTPASAISFMVFCLLYSPCLPTLSVFKKEIGMKWTVLSVIFQFTIAYIIALLTFNVYRLVEVFGGVNVFFVILGIFAILLSFISIIERIRKKKVCTYCDNCGRCKTNK